jgi:hypothetical protein
MMLYPPFHVERCSLDAGLAGSRPRSLENAREERISAWRDSGIHSHLRNNSPRNGGTHNHRLLLRRK